MRCADSGLPCYCTFFQHCTVRISVSRKLKLRAKVWSRSQATSNLVLLRRTMMWRREVLAVRCAGKDGKAYAVAHKATLRHSEMECEWRAKRGLRRKLPRALLRGSRGNGFLGGGTAARPWTASPPLKESRIERFAQQELGTDRRT